MRRFFLFTFSLITSGMLFTSTDAVFAYTATPQVKHVWDDLKPYFLPEDHPIKAKLDQIFSKQRASYSKNSLQLSGFKFRNPKKILRVVVARHEKIKGYLLKIYTDDQPFLGEWVDMKNRILGAYYTQQAIDRHGYNKLFKVPKKWIYPLPPEPAAPQGCYQKHFILVVEDMKILGLEKNYYFYRSIAMTEEIMKAIFTICKEVGLSDSLFPPNIPFSKDHKLAFVDTQHFHHWPIKIDRLIPYLHPLGQKYWIELINGEH